MNDSFDPDSNLYNTHGFTNTTYFTPETLKAMIKENNDISFSVLHLNIRSLNKNFESLENLLVEINFCFKVICITESWRSDDLHSNNRYQILQIIDLKSKNIFINTIYRQPSENKEHFENYFGKFLEKTKTKITYLLGDFNLNLLDYDTNCKVKFYRLFS